jgi:hypothetical protein
MTLSKTRRAEKQNLSQTPSSTYLFSKQTKKKSRRNRGMKVLYLKRRSELVVCCLSGTIPLLSLCLIIQNKHKNQANWMFLSGVGHICVPMLWCKSDWFLK